MSTTPQTSRPLRILALLGRDAATDNVVRLLAEEGLRVTLRDPKDVPDAWQGDTPPHAVLVDERVEPSSVGDAIAKGWVQSTSPVFVVARRLPDRDRYMEWLQAGAWDILKVPLENVALALRLHNILRGHMTPQEVAETMTRYSFDSLVRVADETLSLAHRYDRPLHCAAVALNWPEAPRDEVSGVLDRLAGSVQRLTRRSDLIGIADGRSLLLLLPDTDESGARTFLARLDQTLQQELKAWGILATLRCALVAGQGRASGGELLDAAVGAVR